MDTNQISALVQALALKSAAPSGEFWTQLIPYIGALILAIVGWIKMNTIEHKTDIAATNSEEAKTAAKITEMKADAAHVVGKESSETVKTILVDVNSKNDVLASQNKECQARIVQLSEKIASLEGRLSPTATTAPVIAPVAPGLTEAHLEQIARRVNELSKPDAGRLETVLAVPSTFDGPGGSAVPIAPEQLKQMVGNQK